MSPSRFLPVPAWARHYDRSTLGADLLAAVIVTIMLIPQSLAYALLAGLPPEAGLYASIVPIILYALFGTSNALAVGPVAVVSLMTAAAVGNVAASGTMGYATAALTLAALSGAMLLALGLLRMGFVANFLSHPVIAGFITASGLLIAASQLGHLIGVPVSGHTLPEMLASLWNGLPETNLPTLLLGAGATAFLFWVRGGLAKILQKAGLSQKAATIIARAGPVLAVAVTTALVAGLDLEAQGVAVVGEVPQALPPFTLPDVSPSVLAQLALPALLISIIGFVESVSVAQTLAARRRERIDPNRELIGLGAANMGAAFSGGFPVTGGFARSVVNFDAGARTPAAGAFTAGGIAIAALALTPLIHDLPKATLAATIIVAVLSLVDFSILRRAWRYDHADFYTVAATIALTLLFGVEVGVSAGVLLSVGLHLWRNSRPHVAEVGLVPGTQHFRNLNRHDVALHDKVVTYRIDEALWFANARFLEDLVLGRLARSPEVTDIVLMCSAVNAIDLSALESLEAIDKRLSDQGVRLHLSEVKGPVMDRLKGTHFLEHLSGRVFLSQFDAWCALCGSAKRAEPAAE
ncbi:SulP family inorganic anion transporter [Histidinibacterium aquaticum]|uniref:Sulfate permease n=1 Tax=Histidinibacterium aquaticum TaxID=2613962 RepID=A0A5J5GII9_9RHOB|nr:sulfate permease [Histidinibacterium aquaticum]KAA9008031.1 sulfate permease [Histidinibacterium aquaticum]